MDNAGYVALARQSGLLGELRTIANNIANMSTTGYRREGVIFAEHVDATGPEDPSLSSGHAVGRSFDPTQGVLAATGGTFDLAIEGEGYFLVATPEGDRLTRAGAFTSGPDGTLMTADGMPLLDSGGAPIQIDPTARPVTVTPDGTVEAGGVPVAQVGVFVAAATPRPDGGTRFAFDGDPLPAEGFRVFQGFLEGSNVNPVREIARMIEVQRAYELGQGLLDREDARIRAVIQAMAR